MGFHLRKSFKVDALRFNLSNSGLGFSVGPKGLRIGVDGKGRGYIGGGKGMLRYRQQISGESEDNNINNSFDIDEIPFEIKKQLINGMDIALMVICSPIVFIFLIVFVSSLFAPKFDIGVNIFAAIFLFLSLLPYKKLINKNQKQIKNIIRTMEEEENYLIIIEKLQELNKFSTSYDTKVWIAEKIINCYEDQKDYERALEFAKNEVYLKSRRETVVKYCFLLEKWDDLVSYLQTAYDEKDKKDNPVYYAMLGRAFLKQNLPEVALETMLSGPSQKKSMDAQMCAFRYTLGEVYEALSDNENALKQYSKVYAFDVDFENVKEKIENLKSK